MVKNALLVELMSRELADWLWVQVKKYRMFARDEQQNLSTDHQVWLFDLIITVCVYRAAVIRANGRYLIEARNFQYLGAPKLLRRKKVRA